jgi:hypothetical protein
MMETNINDKGKIFTNVITKKPVSVTIQTKTQRIHGELYVRIGERLKDEINSAEQFLAVTNAIVFDNVNLEKVQYRCHFLLVNLEQIIWLIPDDEIDRRVDEEVGEKG